MAKQDAVVKIRPLIGLLGVLLATSSGDLNDYLSSLALVDIRSPLGVGFDSGTWLDSLYLSAQPVGMAISAWIMVTLSLRRWCMAVIALVGTVSTLIPLAPNVEAFYALRILQGLGGGLITPLLMDAALFTLPPPIRLYGLAVYATTATFVPALAATLAAFWLDILHWNYVFYQATPLCALGIVLVWYGLPQEPPQYARFKLFDWRAVLLLAFGVCSLTTMLYQGDRLNWFDSPLICILALISAICIPLLFINEWFHPLPLLKLQMMARRNFSYGIVAFFVFIIVSQAATNLPVQFLEGVQDFRPLQSQYVTLLIASMQFLMLPLLAFVLDFEQVDARFVSALGIVLMIVSCVGSSFVTIYWDRDQFYLWQAVAAIGQPMVVMPLLMFATNQVKARIEAPWASAMVNFPRAVAEVVAVWLLDLIDRWRGALHYNRIVDEAGLRRWTAIQGPGVLPQHPPPLLPDGQQSFPNALGDFAASVARQAEILTFSDKFLVLGALMVGLLVLVALLPVRTYPPRIEAKDI